MMKALPIRVQDESVKDGRPETMPVGDRVGDMLHRVSKGVKQ